MIWSRLRRLPFKLIHSHCPFSSGRLAVYAARKHRVPLIGTFHSKYKSDLKGSFMGYDWFVRKIMGRILDFFNSCDEVWIPQAMVEETVREYGFMGKVTVVENGNDFADIIDGGDVFAYKRKARVRLGRDPRRLFLIFVGQHIVPKGIMVIADALRLLKDKVDFEMHFVGTGCSLVDLKKRIREAGIDDRVTYHGVIKERDRLSDLYAASDLFLFPSEYDNAPLVVREAAAMGTPSILAEGSTAAEVVRDGINGFTSAVNAESFAETIRQISLNRELLDNVSLEARNTLVRSWRNVVDEVAERYQEIMGRHGRDHKFDNL